MNDGRNTFSKDVANSTRLFREIYFVGTIYREYGSVKWNNACRQLCVQWSLIAQPRATTMNGGRCGLAQAIMLSQTQIRKGEKQTKSQHRRQWDQGRTHIHRYIT